MLCCPGVSGTSLNHRSAAQGLVAALLSVGLTVLPLAGARAMDFRTGPVEGLFDLTLSYGMIYRTESRDEDFIAIANGGNAPTANLDDGNLNYDTGSWN